MNEVRARRAKRAFFSGQGKGGGGVFTSLKVGKEKVHTAPKESALFLGSFFKKKPKKKNSKTKEKNTSSSSSSRESRSSFVRIRRSFGASGGKRRDGRRALDFFFASI